MKYIHTKRFYFLLIFIPSVIIFLIVFYLFYSNDLDKQKINADNVNGIEMVKIMTKIIQIEKTLENASKAINQYNEEPTIQKDILNLAFLRDGFYKEMHLITSDGKIIQSSNESLVGTDVADNEQYDILVGPNKNILSRNKIITSDKKTEINIMSVPYYDEKYELKNVLMATLDLNEILLSELSTIEEPENRVLINELNVPIFGNSDLLTEKNRLIYEFPINDWRIRYKIDSVPLSVIFGDLLFSFLIGFGMPHLLYAFIIILSLKQREKEKQLEVLEQFAASTAHEIRNPLTGIKGFISLLEKKYHDQEDKLYFQIVKDEINQINEITSEFLFLGKPIFMEKKTFHLQQNLHSSFTLLSSMALPKNITIDTNIDMKDIEILGEYKYLNQILLNIGKNAIEASEEGSNIKIIVRNESNKKAIIKVTDEGIGITNEDLDKLFTPFHTTKEMGNGLGLVVCKKIIESYNGSIKINSIHRQGTTVHIELPIERKNA